MDGGGAGWSNNNAQQWRQRRGGGDEVNKCILKSLISATHYHRQQDQTSPNEQTHVAAEGSGLILITGPPLLPPPRVQINIPIVQRSLSGRPAKPDTLPITLSVIFSSHCAAYNKCLIASRAIGFRGRPYLSLYNKQYEWSEQQQQLSYSIVSSGQARHFRKAILILFWQENDHQITCRATFLPTTRTLRINLLVEHFQEIVIVNKL